MSDLRTMFPGDSAADGWHPNSMTPQHSLFEVLRVGGRIVASVEAFSDSGPWYANACDTKGEWHRGGPRTAKEAAFRWAESVAGYQVRQ